MMLLFADRCIRFSVLALTALAVGGCGSDDPEPDTPSAVAARCDLTTVSPGDDVPSWLLPDGAAVIAAEAGATVAVVDDPLAEVFAALKQRAGSAGLTVTASERESFDAELELEGPDGRLDLALEPARGCDGATQVTIR